MNFVRGLSFQRQDPEWVKKIAIGGLISLVPILNFAAIGFAMDTLRNVYHGRETPLPTWDELGTLFVRGLIVVLVQLLWALPLLVLLCPGFLLLALTGALSGNEDPSALLVLANVCIWGLYVAVALALVPLMLAAQARYAVSNDFSAALPGPVLNEVRRNLGPWLTVVGFAFLIGLLLTIAAVPLIVLTLGLGVFLIWPLQFYMQLAAAHWQAQAHRESIGASTLPPSMV